MYPFDFSVLHAIFFLILAFINPQHDCLLFYSWLPPSATAQAFLFLYIHYQLPQALCFIVLTHHAHIMLEKQRNLFPATKAFPTIFSSLLFAKHFCLLIILLWTPQAFQTHHNIAHILLGCLKSNGYIWTPQFLQHATATMNKETVLKMNLRTMMYAWLSLWIPPALTEILQSYLTIQSYLKKVVVTHVLWQASNVLLI